VRVLPMFIVYLTFVAAGLAYAIAIGLLHL
jgi:hypothetical protein